MSVDGAASQSAGNGTDGNTRKSCPLYGCKRVYTEMAALENHIKDHEIQAESLPGKVMLCSVVGCSGSFCNMQKLMEHMRHHHKPSIFFLCESCRSKLRSFRGLLTHLHTCSKVPRSKKPTEQAPAGTNPNTSPMEMEQDAPQQEPESAPQQQSYLTTQNPEYTLTAAVSHQDPGDPRPPCSSSQEPSSQQGTREPENEASDQFSSLSSGTRTVTPDPPEAQHKTQTTSSEPSAHPSSGAAPHSPPGPMASWRKNQGPSVSRRML